MNLVVIGTQWGDEGKGKIVDYLSEQAAGIIRYSGGANAGHTIVHGDTTYKLHLIPSGVIYSHTQVVLGTGMVIDLESLKKELATLTEQGIEWEGRLFISDRAHIVLPSYKKMDVEIDKQRARPIGTTGRGIGVTYAKKASRDGFRVADLLSPAADSWIKELNQEDQSYVIAMREFIRPMVIDLTEFNRDLDGKKVLLEGAQGALLDLDTGTYPFVSSGISSAAGAAVGSGFGPRDIHGVLGVCKAYSTRVGNGPFPSQFNTDTEGELEKHVREVGREYGVTTGRVRRCGYLDLVALRYTCRVNSVDQLALTHLDVYDGIEELQVCIGYEIDGQRIEHFPADVAALEKARPINTTLPGWKESVAEVRDFEKLPANAKRYIAFIEDFVQTPVSIVSVGYERKQTFVRSSPWKQ
ncbi:adenylosuccinate synthase [Spirochaeta africana]|uniref:Adenylosuccinate synthetase n=1 Tax=Spirochaeta africana (strain ATCC 700263 / DSM 8902 / Z-7692) TaxID=889378 RepID=H9UJH4_SPIAZ|nr:adenylosuccinate synthase [Spirochaeta africana]AFG37667.1 adenylosuccinate synthase [Spirochaeta africana DSM 8902]